MAIPRKYTKEVLEEAAKASISMNGVIRYMGARLSGGLHTHLKKLMVRFDVDTSHFLGQAYAKAVPREKKDPAKILVAGKKVRTGRRHLYRCLIELGVPYLCALCGHPPEWRGMPLMLQIDHINGDWSDDRAENLRFLCPHCHTQQPTFCNRRRTPVPTPCEDGSEEVLGSHMDICKRPNTTKGPKTPKVSTPKHHLGKVTWPSKEQLQALVWDQPVLKLAASLGVSDVAVKKRCKRLGITTPPRGYWAKLKADQFWPPDSELEKLVWAASFREIGETLGVTPDLVGVRCRERNIQTPPQGHWNRNR